MNPESIIAAWLNDASITALVGTRKALVQLPANSTFPALVYNVVDSIPQPTVAANLQPELAQARIQFNPLATTVGGVIAIKDALRALLDFKHQVTIGGKLVVSMRLIDVGPMEKDIDSGLFTQRVDYRLWWYET